MADLVGSSEWAAFHALFEDAADTFAQHPITWRRVMTNLDRWKEDNQDGQTVDVQLVCLNNYNYMRSWPVTNFTEAGEVNSQSVQVLFGMKYLRDLGYLDNNNKFMYNQDKDRFILNGHIMKAAGDTPVSQAYDSDIWYSVILVEQPTATGDKRN
jgi:hypothetical protein